MLQARFSAIIFYIFFRASAHTFNSYGNHGLLFLKQNITVFIQCDPCCFCLMSPEPEATKIHTLLHAVKFKNALLHVHFIWHSWCVHPHYTKKNHNKQLQTYKYFKLAQYEEFFPHICPSYMQASCFWTDLGMGTK